MTKSHNQEEKHVGEHILEPIYREKNISEEKKHPDAWRCKKCGKRSPFWMTFQSKRCNGGE